MNDGQHRSALGTTALTAAVLSALAFVALLIGAFAGSNGFDEGEKATTVVAVVWFSFVLGALVALFFGVFALILGPSRGMTGDARAGRLAVGWFLIAVLTVIVMNARDGFG